MKNISYVKDIIPYLQKTIQNYEINQTQLAKKINITPTMISEYLKGARKPNKTTIQKILSNLYKIWQSGIIELPPLKNYWNKPLYIPVLDIKNPFETWKNIYYYGVEENDFEEWMKTWEEKNQFNIIKIYPSYDIFKKSYYKDSIEYNSIQENQIEEKVHAIISKYDKNFYKIQKENIYAE